VFAVAVVSDDVRCQFDLFGLTEAIGEERYFGTLDEAIAAFPQSVRELEDVPPAFHLLVKPTGAVCNLDSPFRCGFDRYQGGQARIRRASSGRRLEEPTPERKETRWQSKRPTHRSSICSRA